MGSSSSVVAIAAKDIAQRMRDRSAIIMGFVGPLALALVLSATVGSADDPSAFEFGLADDDHGVVADGFQGVLGDLERDGVVVVTAASGLDELEQLVDDGDVAAGFHLPSGLSERGQAAGPGSITVVGDPGSPVAVDVAEAIATTYAAEVDYVSLTTAAVIAAGGSASSDDPVVDATAAALAEPIPIELAPIETAGRGTDLSTYYAVSISVFFLFFSVQFGVLSLIEEREGGTLDRILMAPISRTAVLVGKLTSSLVVGVTSMVVLVAATTLAVDAQWGDTVAVAVMILVGVLVAIALAAVVSVVARTAEQAMAFASAAALVFGLLGGTFFPISRADGALATVSMMSPHRWLLDGFRDVSYGAGVSDLVSTLAVLLTFIVIVGGIGLTAAARGLSRR